MVADLPPFLFMTTVVRGARFAGIRHAWKRAVRISPHRPTSMKQNFFILLFIVCLFLYDFPGEGHAVLNFLACLVFISLGKIYQYLRLA